MLRTFVLMLLWCCPAWGFGAPTVGVATIVDGEAVLIRETSRSALAEGVRMQAGDIVESAAAAGIVRLEFANGAVLDLGPDTRVLLMPRFHAERRQRPAFVYLLQGWTKLEVPAPAPAPVPGIAAAPVDALTAAGSSVERVAGAEVGVFQESGQGSVVEPAAGRAPIVRALRAGESYTYRDAKGAVAPRPAPQFLEALPRAFRDTLPRRADRFTGPERAPKPLPALRYADIEAWLKAEPALRLALVPRWQRLAATADFRKALVSNLREHPEWERILFPPKPSPNAPPNPPSSNSPPSPAGYPAR